MRYEVILSHQAEKVLKKLDRKNSMRITEWIKKNLDGCENPREYGRALTGDLKGLWRYRVGDYRIIADIQDDKVIILITEIGHRSKIYD